MDEANNVWHISITAMDMFRYLPIAGAMFLAFRLRKQLIASVKPLFIGTVVLACLSSIGYSGYQMKVAWDNARADTSAWRTAEQLKQWRKIMPGPWEQLYNEIKAYTYYETKLMTIEKFTSAQDNLPALPPEGLNELLKQVHSNENAQMTEHIERVMAAVGEHVVPLCLSSEIKLASNDGE